MNTPLLSPTDSMIAIRDEYLSPSLLSPLADDMARRLSRFSMGPLLEMSADTGMLTQAIASVMSASLAIIATDPDPAAVACGSAKPGMTRVAWQQACSSALPFADRTFGVVTCQNGVVAFPDRVKAFREVRRVLKVGGRFVFSVPAHMRHNPVAQFVHETMAEVFPNDPPLFVGSTLHGYSDHDIIDNELTEAGFTDAIYTLVELPYAAASAHDVAVGYCLGTPLRSEIEARAPGEATRVVQVVATALSKAFGSGPIEAKMRAHVISASG